MILWLLIALCFIVLLVFWRLFNLTLDLIGQGLSEMER